LPTGDVIRGEALRRYGTEQQHILRLVGHELRQEQGPGAICSAAITNYREQAGQYRGVVVSGMRAVEAAQVIHDESGLLIYVDAPLQTRFERLTRRNRTGEPTSLGEFEKF